MTTELSQLKNSLKEAEEENELLIAQLHLVQEELERYYLRNKELESNPSLGVAEVSGTTANAWMPEELPELLAEKQRLEQLLTSLQEKSRIERTNSLSARIGNMLIEADVKGSKIGALLKIIKIGKNKPLSALGGKSFSKVIEVFNKKSFAGVEVLLNQATQSPLVRANAYTALARHLQQQHLPEQVVQAARLAYEQDPEPYRLKWLAFRLQDGNEIQEAEALLNLLPADINFSDSEQNRIGKIRYQAQHERLTLAKRESNYEQRVSQVRKQARQLEELQTSLSQQVQKAEEASQKLQVIKQQQAESTLSLNEEIENRKIKAAEQEKLNQQNKLQEQKISELTEENGLLIEQVHHVQEELEKYHLQQAEYEQKTVELLAVKNLQTEQLESTQKQLDEAKALQQQYALEKDTLFEQTKAQEEELKKLEDQQAHLVNSLTEAREQLIIQQKQQNELLTPLHAEKMQLIQSQEKIYTQYVEIEAIKTDLIKQVNLHQAQYKELSEQFETTSQELALLQQQQHVEQQKHRELLATLHAEKMQLLQILEKVQPQFVSAQQQQIELTTKLGEQANQQQELKKFNEELKQQLSKYKEQQVKSTETEAELNRRLQLMNEEMQRAEVQIELIKEMFLNEPDIQIKA